MTDPHIPVERGLRATVRLAAGINIGDGERSPSAGARLGAGLRAIGPRLSALRDRLGCAVDGEVLSHCGRHVVLGAATGATIIACSFVALAAQAVMSAEPTPHEVAMTAIEPIGKSDRLTVGAGKLASIASAVAPIGSAGGDLTITTRAEAPRTTVAMPALAFASAGLFDTAAVAAIDRVLDAAPIAAAQPQDPIIGEEEDDIAVVPLVLPMPRVRPEHAASALPMPKPRPRFQLASLSSPTAPSGEEAAPEPPARTAEPQTMRPTGPALGFFSSPTDPVKAPPRITVDTPFGVPYVLQTGSVETACIKPELVTILRNIEGHYHQKVIITSGFRDRGRQGSLHRQCAAVDIQVPGVDAAALASYSRTIPDIGGVGTYCHPNMIHVDIGTPRDWKYGCGSFFAMRGGVGKWGKVPGSLARAKTGAPVQTVTDAQQEEE